MSAEVTPDDAAKVRAEERAERELQLKIDTLELEREKFSYTSRQGLMDRFGAASLRAATALLFANGSSLLLSFTSYKSLLDVFPTDVLRRSAFSLFVGFVVANVAFVSALILSARPSDHNKQIDKPWMFFLYMCAFFGFLSFAALGFALLQPVVFLRRH